LLQFEPKLHGFMPPSFFSFEFSKCLKPGGLEIGRLSELDLQIINKRRKKVEIWWLNELGAWS